VWTLSIVSIYSTLHCMFIGRVVFFSHLKITSNCLSLDQIVKAFCDKSVNTRLL